MFLTLPMSRLFWRPCVFRKWRCLGFDAVWTAPRRCCTRSLCSPSAPSPPRSSTSRTSFRTTRRSSSSLNSEYHRVERVPGFLSSRPSWLSPPPHPQASVAPPPPQLWFRGGGGWGHTCLRERGFVSNQFGWRERLSDPLGIIYSLHGEYLHTYLIVYVFNICSCTSFMLYFPSFADPIQIWF